MHTTNSEKLLLKEVVSFTFILLFLFQCKNDILFLFCILLFHPTLLASEGLAFGGHKSKSYTKSIVSATKPVKYIQNENIHQLTSAQFSTPSKPISPVNQGPIDW